MSADDVVELLNDLIETSQDGRRGFAEAAELVPDANLKSMLILQSSRCAVAVDELKLAVQRLGREPDESGSLAGSLHRGWTRAKAALEQRNTAVLEEVERGEDHAKHVYERVLTTPLPPEVKKLVRKQYRGLLRMHDRIRVLRGIHQATAA